jgi:hypothetical protein
MSNDFDVDTAPITEWTNRVAPFVRRNPTGIFEKFALLAPGAAK